MPVGNSSIVLVDTHRHGLHGHLDSLDQFVHVSQNVLDLQDDTYANLSFFFSNEDDDNDYVSLMMRC